VTGVPCSVRSRGARRRRRLKGIWLEGGGPPPPVFSEVFILKGFKSCVLEVRILRDLQAGFAEVRILKELVIGDS
jgi:hypothetical protein